MGALAVSAFGGFLLGKYMTEAEAALLVYASRECQAILITQQEMLEKAQLRNLNPREGARVAGKRK